MTAEGMRAKRRTTYQNMHEIVKLAKKYSPKLVKGYSAGNISVVDKKSWLEVCDRKHRYGANLRAYYKEWKRQPTKPSFWEWLDDESIEVAGVPRTKLERETVLYCDTAAERQKFALSVLNGVIVHDSTQEIVETGQEGWIFVLRDGVLYGSQKETKKIPRIHHTSFVGGECVQTAGMMVIVDGVIKTIYPHSGHYRPSEYELLVLLRFLVKNGVDLSDVEVDVQRIQKVFRDTVNGALVKKLDNAHFWNAYRVWYFLERKHLAWKCGLFDELVETVGRKTDMQVTLDRSDILEDVMMEQCNDPSSEIAFKDGSVHALAILHPAYEAPSFEDAAKQLAACQVQPSATTNGHAPPSGDGSVVLSQIHVSCYITAANRATPVFEVLPQRNCVRVVTRSPGDAALNDDGRAGGSGATGGVVSTGTVPTAEWGFHSVFLSGSLSHAVDFFREITQPALRSARGGINANVVVWGVHPTQKFRLLFGKSVGAPGGASIPQSDVSVQEVVELYGQLGGILQEFFSDPGAPQLQRQEASAWRLGISSWIIVNNQAFDLLETSTVTPAANCHETSSSCPRVEPQLSFVSLEATSLANAFRIIQTAKTNRIVRKQDAEHAHFFVRLAFFHCGQVSTLHFVDLIDQKDFKDPVLSREKLELYSILHDLRQPPPSPRRQGNTPVVASGGSAAPSPVAAPDKMTLSNFMLPLLIANAKTFLYANVIDSRTSLRESVQMLNVVANLRGFSCVCNRLRGVVFEQLCFQIAPTDFDGHNSSSQAGKSKEITMPEAQAAVDESVLNRLVSSSSSSLLGGLHAAESTVLLERPLPTQGRLALPPSTTGAAESEAMSWLEAFTQRKRDILGGTIDTISHAVPTSATPSGDVPTMPAPEDSTGSQALSASSADLDGQQSIIDLYERLRGPLTDAEDRNSTTATGLHGVYSSSPSRPFSSPCTPLPIIDQDATRGFSSSGAGSNDTRTAEASTRQQTQPTQTDRERSAWSQQHHAAIERHDDVSPSRSCNAKDATTPAPWLIARSCHELEAVEKAGVPSRVMVPPNVDGLDIATARKVQAADATLLRKNYDALLAIVREQQQAKEAAEARAAEAIHDEEELRAGFEVQIENMKLANVALRSKVRALEKRSALPQVFNQYEQELRALHAQVQQLQARNVALELRANSSDGSRGSAVGSTGPASDWKKKYQQVVEEKLELERDMMELRKRESSKEEALVATRLSQRRLNAEMNQALEKADLLHQENEKLLIEKAVTTEELLATRMHLASQENEKQKASILERFVAKHGDRMSRLRQSDSTTSLSSKGRGESWRRDQYARECEDKLLAAVKRSLPQAVPLCNKLLRRLELQELSLRELSEREVDFINLLVELVSDQPAISLKHMIEEEMKKLQPC
ncbi:hypothetical protein BBJ28_00000242 [Nothophytophthora sp. Chile5]|nr:hypothetical protein BBJ28_00000242 [Nothophytophthora sp. Chile5]